MVYSGFSFKILRRIFKHKNLIGIEPFCLGWPVCNVLQNGELSLFFLLTLKVQVARVADLEL